MTWLCLGETDNLLLQMFPRSPSLWLCSTHARRTAALVTKHPMHLFPKPAGPDVVPGCVGSSCVRTGNKGGRVCSTLPFRSGVPTAINTTTSPGHSAFYAPVDDPLTSNMSHNSLQHKRYRNFISVGHLGSLRVARFEVAFIFIIRASSGSGWGRSEPLQREDTEAQA